MLSLLVTAMMEPLLRWSSVAIISNMEITSKCLIICQIGGGGGGGGVYNGEASSDSIIHSNYYSKLRPFFLSSFYVVTFEQMTIKHSMYMQKVPLYVQKGPVWFFLVLGFTLEEKLHGEMCCKFYGPEGVPKHIGMNEGFSFTPWQILIAIDEVLIEICNGDHVWHVLVSIFGI